MARPMLSVDIDTAKLTKKLRRYPQILDAVSDRVVQDETEDVARDMRRFAPVRTRQLVESIQAEHKRGTAQGRAVARARHARFVEKGTKRTKAQPYAEPAHEISGPRFRKRLIEAINQEVRRKR